MSETPIGGTMIVRRQTDGAGYSDYDARASGEGREEYDVACCPHCQCTINWQEWRADRAIGGGVKGGWCRKCFAPVCPNCTTRMLSFGCEPYIKLVEERLEANYRIQQNLKVLGI